jgi:hypothetical protein
MLNKNGLDERSDPMTAERRQTPFRVGAHCYLWALFLFFLGFAAPIVEGIFANYGVPLPRLTNLVFGVSHVVAWPVPAIITIPSLLLALLCVDWLVLTENTRRGEEGLAMAWSMILFACPLFLIALSVLGMILPLLSITTGLSG